MEDFYSDKYEKWMVEEYVEVIIDFKNLIGGYFEIIFVYSDYVVVSVI